MIKWKDFLYFSKGDRVAVIILCILICLAGIFSLHLFVFSDVSPAYISGAEEQKKSFAEFENSMLEAEIEVEPADTVSPRILSSRKNKPPEGKLTEGQTLDLNSASKESLMRIPGIGNTLAERIVAYRTELGGFANAEQLQEVKGITVNRFSNILPYVVLKKKHRKIRLNRDSEDKLSAHPYLDHNQVGTILLLRESGKIASLDELAENEHFTARDISRLQAYLSFE